MSTFRHLEAPEYREYFNHSGTTIRGWINTVKGESEYYSLHTDGELCWYHDSTETALFDSELHALDEAFNYYLAHGEFYPYHTIWQNAVARNNGLVPAAAPAVPAVGSHKMEFI